MDDAEPLWSQAEMQAAFGIGRRLLRDFEQRGLLKPVRVGQVRAYSAADRDRLLFVMQARQQDFTFQEIGALLAAAEVSGPAHLPSDPAAIRARLAALGTAADDDGRVQ